MKKTSPQQTFLVLSMFFADTPATREPKLGDPMVKALRPAKVRKELEEAGVLRVVKRGRTSYLLLDSEAHEFVMRNLGTPLPKTARAAKLLEQVLGRVQQLLQTHGHSLDELMGGGEHAHLSAGGGDGADGTARAGDEALRSAPLKAPEDAVREACLALTHGEKRRRVRLADLRRTIAVRRELLDDTLLSMQTAGQLVLYKMENPAEISVEDEQAALYIADQPRHLVYLEA